MAFLVCSLERPSPDGPCRRDTARAVTHQIETICLLELAAALVETISVGDLEEAQVELVRRSYCGMVIDLAVVSSYATLRHIRTEWPLLPLLLVAPTERPDLINRAHPLRAQCLLAPLAASDLADFFHRARQFVPVERPQLTNYLTSFGTDHALTEREHELMVASLDRVERGELLHRFRISENTLKSQVRGLLRKTGQASMDALLRSVMRDVLSQQGLAKKAGGSASPSAPPGAREC